MNSTLDSLRSRIAILYNESTRGEDLGNLALEILIKRNEARQELENNPTFEKKNEIERRIDALHELESAVVSLHMLQGIKSAKQSFGLADVAQPRYNLFSKKVMS